MPSLCLVLQSAVRRRAWPKVAPVRSVRRSIYTFSLGRRRMSTSERAGLFRSAWRFPFECDVSAARLQPRSLGPRRALMRNGHFCFLAKAWAEPLPPCPQIIALQSVHKGVANRNLHLAVSRGRTFFSFDGEADPPRPPSHRDDWASAGPVLGQCWASAGPVLGECLRRELGYIRRTGGERSRAVGVAS